MNSRYGMLELNLIAIIGGIIAILGLFMPWVSYGELSSQGFQSDYNAVTLMGAMLMIGVVVLGTNLIWRGNGEMMGIKMGCIGGTLGGIIGLAGVSAAYAEFSSYTISIGFYVSLLGLIIGLFALALINFSEDIFGEPFKRSRSGGL